ncbi:MAG: hypothetical protein RMI30_03045 [Thermodesulfovibrio sp.]|nr:hypothetical protein [Thermodesulfovibrio sp.]
MENIRNLRGEDYFIELTKMKPQATILNLQRNFELPLPKTCIYLKYMQDNSE